MYLRGLRSTIDPSEHIEEVNSDICGDTARLFLIPLPGLLIPSPSGGDIRQLDIVLMAPISKDFILQCDN